MSYQNIREEGLKNKIAKDYFADFDNTKIIRNVDFCINFEKENKLEELFKSKSESLL